MHMRKIAVGLSILLFVSVFLPVASARPVCILENPFVAGAVGTTTSYSCDKVFDAILVSGGNDAFGANIKACLKSSSGTNLSCQEACGFIMFLNVGANVAFVTVTVGALSTERPDCTPTAGTIEVQFGDTRDGGSF